jgi:hypothetical protein
LGGDRGRVRSVDCEGADSAFRDAGGAAPHLRGLAILFRNTPILVIFLVFAQGLFAAEEAIDPGAAKDKIQLEGIAGFGPGAGFARHGRYIPAHIELTAEGEPFAGEIVVRSIAQRKTLVETKRVYEPLLTIPFEAGIHSAKRFSDVFPARREDESLVAELWSDGGKLAEVHMALTQIPEGRMTILALGEAPGRLKHLGSTEHALPSRRRTVISGDIDYLPAHRMGYDAIDAVVFDGASVGRMRDNQIGALKDFLFSGGRVIVCSGSLWQQIDGTFLEELLPVELDETVKIPSPMPTLDTDRPTTAAIPEMLVCRAPLREPESGAEVLWQPEGFWHDRGIEHEIDFPLCVRRSYGAGSLAFLAFRLDEELVRECPYLDALCAMLFDHRPESLLGRLADDSAGLIFSELGNKTLLPLPAPDAVIGAFSLYLFVFLPGLFFLVRSYKGVLWAWGALPLGFVAAAAAIFSYGRSEATRNRAFVQLSFVESSASAPLANGRTFSNIYTPSADRFLIKAKKESDFFLPLQAEPDNSPPGESEPFRFSSRPEATVQGFEISARASRTFQTDYTREVPRPAKSGELTYARDSKPEDADPFSWTVAKETLAGTVVNETDTVLHEAALIGLGRVQKLGDLRVGQEVPVGLDSRKGAPLEEWTMGQSKTGTSVDLGATMALVRSGRQVLASHLQVYGEALLVGWTEDNLSEITAASERFSTVASESAATNATWRIVRYPTVVRGGQIRFDTKDFRIDSWNSAEEKFDWDKRGDYYVIVETINENEEWTVRFRPRIGLRAGSEQEKTAIADAWGSITGDLNGNMDLYDFKQGRWAPAPPPINGRRILLQKPNVPTGARKPRENSAMVFGDDVVDPVTGEIWLRLSGEPFLLKDARIDIALNYKMMP